MRNIVPITLLERQKKHTWTLGSFSLLLKVVDFILILFIFTAWQYLIPCGLFFRRSEAR